MDFDFMIGITFFASTAYIIKVISDNRLRRQLIEKGQLDENVKYLLTRNPDSGYLSSLKWGLVLVGLGLALLIGQLFPRDISDEMTVGGMFLFAGLGFMIYYFIAKTRNAENAG